MPTQTPVARVSLAPTYVPTNRINYSIQVRARKTNAAHTVTMRAALYEGAVNRSNDMESTPLTTAFATYPLYLSDADAALISDHSNLEIRFWGYSSTSDPAVVEVAEIWLQKPTGVPPVVTPITLAAGLTLTPSVTPTQKAATPIRLNVIDDTNALAEAFGDADDPTFVLTPTMRVSVVKKPAVTMTLTPTMTRGSANSRSLAASLTLTPAVIKKLPKTVPLTVTLTPVMSRVKFAPRSVVASLTMTPALSKVAPFLRSISASMALTPAISRKAIYYRTLNPSLTMVGALTDFESFLRTVSATLTLTGAESHSASHTFPDQILGAVLGLTPTMATKSTRNISLPVTVGTNPTFNFRKFNTLSATLLLPSEIMWTVPKLMPVSLTPALSMTLQSQVWYRQFDTQLILTPALGSVFKAPAQVPLPVVMSLASTMTRVPYRAREINATLILTPGEQRRFGKKMPVILIVGQGMYFRRDQWLISFAPTFTLIVEMHPVRPIGMGNLHGATLGPATLLGA